MPYTELESFVVLLQMASVVIVAAYLVTRTRYFDGILEGRLSLRIYLSVILFFGALSIYGSVSGIEVLGAYINIRDLGPMVAGLLCGPVAGVGAGLIGAAYRVSLGGFTVLPCSIATVLAGAFGGIIWYLNGRRFPPLWAAVSFAVFMEAFHMLLVLLLCQPFEQALGVVIETAGPMIVGNAAGMFIFSVIITNLRTERETRAELEARKAELRIAAEIQQTFLPAKISVPEGYEIAAISIPAREIGGDFYDVIALGGGRTGIAVADVSGKGVPAALFMALSRTVLRAAAVWHKDADETLNDANQVIARDAETGMFVTIFYAVLDPVRNTLEYVNAGHNPPLFLAATAEAPVPLMPTGIAAGALEESRYSQACRPLEPGDLLVMYTDGVTEATDGSNEMYGEERLVSCVLANRSKPAEEVMAAVQGDLMEFCAGEAQFDDITILVLKVVGRNG